MTPRTCKQVLKSGRPCRYTAKHGDYCGVHARNRPQDDTINICDLPEDVIYHIFGFLTPSDVVRIAKTSRLIELSAAVYLRDSVIANLSSKPYFKNDNKYKVVPGVWWMRWNEQVDMRTFRDVVEVLLLLHGWNRRCAYRYGSFCLGDGRRIELKTSATVPFRVIVTHFLKYTCEFKRIDMQVYTGDAYTDLPHIFRDIMSCRNTESNPLGKLNKPTPASN